MFEAGILLTIVVVLVAVGDALWRYARPRERRLYVRFGRLILSSAGSILLVAGLTYQLMNARTFQLFGEIVPRVTTSQPVVALTFDDGPTALTEEVLSLLRTEGVTATFFVTGAELSANPDAGERIIQEGHELGNHSYSHPRMIFKSPAFIREELEQTDLLIRRAGQNGPIHFRSPNGKKLLLLPFYLSRTNRKNIFWDIEPDSGPAATAEQMVEQVAARARPGSIILLHVMYPARAESLKAVPGIIRALRERGYRFVTVSELLSAQ